MSKLILVETVAQFRLRYVAEIDDAAYASFDQEKPILCQKSEWPAVVSVQVTHEDPNFHEFSQEHLSNMVYSHREVTKEQYLQAFDRDNEHLTSLTEEEKLNYVNVLKPSLIDKLQER